MSARISFVLLSPLTKKMSREMCGDTVKRAIEAGTQSQPASSSGCTDNAVQRQRGPGRGCSRAVQVSFLLWLWWGRREEEHEPLPSDSVAVWAQGRGTPSLPVPTHTLTGGWWDQSGAGVGSAAVPQGRGDSRVQHSSRSDGSGRGAVSSRHGSWPRSCGTCFQRVT